MNKRYRNTNLSLSDDVQELIKNIEIVDDEKDPAMEEYYRRLERREILWNDDIDESMMDVALLIYQWNLEDIGKKIEDRKNIKLFINSDGGCYHSVMALIDMIELSETPVITIGMGTVFSAAGMLLMAGHYRYILPHTQCLIHNGESGTSGTMDRLMDRVDMLTTVERSMREFILSHSLITEEQYDTNYRRDWFLDAYEMTRLGVADEILTDMRDILV